MNNPKVKVFVAKADVVNGNNRFYPRDELENAAKAYRNRGAPQFLMVDDTACIAPSLDKVVGVVHDLYLEGNILYAELSALETPLSAVIWDEGVLRPNVAIRTIGSGLIEEDTNGLKVKDFEIAYLNAYVNVPVSWKEDCC